MILGIGHDLQNIGRIKTALQRHEDRFLRRCFTAAEVSKAMGAGHEERRAAILALRFAAKEACAKALGTGFRNGIAMRNIGVANDPLGKPFLQLTGKAAERLNDLTSQGMSARLHLSLSDDPPLASAFVVIEAVSS